MTGCPGDAMVELLDEQKWGWGDSPMIHWQSRYHVNQLVNIGQLYKFRDTLFHHFGVGMSVVCCTKLCFLCERKPTFCVNFVRDTCSQHGERLQIPPDMFDFKEPNSHDKTSTDFAARLWFKQHRFDPWIHGSAGMKPSISDLPNGELNG